MLTLLLFILQRPTPVDSSPPTRYHFVNRSTVELGGGAPIVLALDAWVEVTLRDSAQGHLVHVLIDSSAFDASGAGDAVPAPMTASPKGTSIDAFVVNGHVVKTQASAPVMQTMQLFPAVQLLLAGTRSAQAGENWVDSTRTDTTDTAATAHGTQVINWAARTDDSLGLVYDGTITGHTSVGAGAMQMQFAIVGASHVTRGATGGVLPASASSSSSGIATMSGGTGTRAMKVVNDVTVTAMP